MKDQFKSGLWSSLWTFLALFAVTALKFLSQIAEWAGSNGHQPFPDVSVVGYAVISAVVAALSGLIAFAVRVLQAKNVVPGNAPVFPDAKV